jgi:SPP1 gp7 family putative phage head morphogenesis protein
MNLKQLAPLLQAGAKQKRGRKASATAVQPSKRIEIKYTAALLDIVSQLEAETNKIIIPSLKANLGDAWYDDIFARLKALIAQLHNKAPKLAKETVEKQAEQVDAQLGKILQKSTGIDLEAVIKSENLSDALQKQIAANATLIKDIPTQYATQLEKIIMNGVQSGRLAKDIAPDIANLLGTTKQRAKLIARDQIGKITSSINQVRQTQLGIDGYTWSTSQDERVRHDHRLREGLVYVWGEAPSDGHPGMAVNCRCAAIPYIDDLLDNKAPSAKTLAEKALITEKQNDDLLGWMRKSEINRVGKEVLSKPRLREFMQNNNLTLPEAIAIRNYTGDGYEAINAMHYGKIVKGDDLFDELQLASSVLSSALEKLPNHVGQVVRRTELPDGFLADHAVGNVVEHKAFISSTSKKSDVFKDYKHRLVIQSKTGKNISTLSNYEKSELEVLFNRPKTFEVRRRITLPDGTIEIELWEVS